MPKGSQVDRIYQAIKRKTGDKGKNLKTGKPAAGVARRRRSRSAKH